MSIFRLENQKYFVWIVIFLWVISFTATTINMSVIFKEDGVNSPVFLASLVVLIVSFYCVAVYAYDLVQIEEQWVNSIELSLPFPFAQGIITIFSILMIVLSSVNLDHYRRKYKNSYAFSASRKSLFLISNVCYLTLGCLIFFHKGAYPVVSLAVKGGGKIADKAGEKYDEYKAEYDKYKASKDNEARLRALAQINDSNLGNAESSSQAGSPPASRRNSLSEQTPDDDEKQYELL